MRRPAPQSLADIQHPGPKAIDRLPYAVCHAQETQVSLSAGLPLLESLGRWADDAGYVSAVLDLSGLQLAPFDYVMPDRAIDDRHAAWYSDTYSSTGVVLTDCVAILGWRDGTWFAHIHAYWQENGHWHLGHLLPDTVHVAHSRSVPGRGLTGARFEAAFDPETEFTLFRTKADPNGMAGKSANALITTLAPFADLHESVQTLGELLPGPDFAVYGLGSLAGAEFSDGAPMTGLISEILLLQGAGRKGEAPLKLPLRTVDLNKTLYQGDALPGVCPTLVTNELLLVSGTG